MKTSIGTWLSVLAVIGMAVPVQAVDSPVRKQSVVSDVALTATGELVGLVVSRSGKPLTGLPVHVVHRQKIIAKVKTDGSGHYRVRGLRTGLHTVQTVNGQSECRFWSADAAPPKVKRQLQLVAGDSVVRGQNGGSIDGGTMLGIAVFGATAAAVAISVSDSDDATPVASSTTPPPASP